jgi:hypothetical protein
MWFTAPALLHLVVQPGFFVCPSSRSALSQTNIKGNTMKNKHIIVTLATLTLATDLVFSAGFGTSFSYQGQLTDGTNAVTGLYDFTFRLYDSSGGSGVVGPAITSNAIPVSNGIFTILLDFGANSFDGNERWLYIRVKTNGAPSYTALAPRQPVTPTPYSMFSSNAAAAASVPVSGLTGTLAPVQMPANAAYVNSNQTFSAQQAFAARVNLSNTVHLYTNAYMNDRDVQLRGDAFHGVGWYGASKTFAGVNVNGPVLYGGSGGALGAVSGTTNIALSWDGSRNVSVPSLLSVSNLGVTGSARLNDHFLYLRSGTDAFHGLAWAGASTNFSDSPDGPVLFGCSGGSLGTMCTPALALSWNYLGNVFTDPSAKNNRSLLPGLTFGPNSGEGISSRRTVGAGQFAIDFYTASAIRMTIDNSGNVGIGQTSPTAKLDVNGTVKAASFSGQGVLTWVDVTGTSQLAQSNTGYVADNASQVVITLPSSPAIGDVVRVTGGGTGGWRVSQNASQRIRIGASQVTTVGATGYLTGAQTTAIELQYVGNNLFLSLRHEGSINAF